MTAEPESADRRVGANVRLHRERLGLKQADIAREMGWPQSTVARTEAGQRPVRVAEAERLAEILKVSVDRLLWSSPEAIEVALAENGIAVLRRAWKEAAEAHGDLLRARHAAGRRLADAQASSHERVRRLAADLAGELEDCTPESAAESAETEWNGREGHGADEEG